MAYRYYVQVPWLSVVIFVSYLVGISKVLIFLFLYRLPWPWLHPAGMLRTMQSQISERKRQDVPSCSCQKQQTMCARHRLLGRSCPCRGGICTQLSVGVRMQGTDAPKLFSCRVAAVQRRRSDDAHVRCHAGACLACLQQCSSMALGRCCPLMWTSPWCGAACLECCPLHWHLAGRGTRCARPDIWVFRALCFVVGNRLRSTFQFQGMYHNV